MKLHNAKLCMNCNEIFTGNSCPICSEVTSSYFLARWLNRSAKHESRLAQTEQQLRLRTLHHFTRRLRRRDLQL